MGVVYAAVDPALERTIALKLLHADRAQGAASDEWRARLLREARAIARLSHPNVIAVHEIGLHGDQPFVAMELVNGRTLRSWLADSPRSWREVVSVFVAAGHGLSAAHRSGLVHRDFKPDNVLIGHDGQVRVTDFGLACPVPYAEHHGVDGVALTAPTAAMGAALDDQGQLTRTGTLVGTPGYMAPEQASGEKVTPAADQFAFCVALWEAFAGKRPYRGLTIGDIRAQAALGSAALDATRIPRRLRPVLRRGLDPDPAKRWPTMDALLARLVRAARRPTALVIGIVTVVTAAALVLAMRGGAAPAAESVGCAPPMRDPARVWSPEVRAALGNQTLAIRAIDADLATWRSVRDAACERAPSARSAHLACLDGVLARIDAIAQVVRKNTEAPKLDASRFLIDPKVCQLARPPRLITEISAELSAVFEAELRRDTWVERLSVAKAEALVSRTENDPCALAYSQLQAARPQRSTSERARRIEETEQAVGRCDDERVKADVALGVASVSMVDEHLGLDTRTKLRLAESAVSWVTQRDLTASLEMMHMLIAARVENFDEAVLRAAAAAAGFAARGRFRAEMYAELKIWELRALRGSDDDLAQYLPALDRLRARAVGELGEDDRLVRYSESLRAPRLLRLGDLAGAHAANKRGWFSYENDPARRVAGQVIDASGVPVAGAMVAADVQLFEVSLAAADRYLKTSAFRSTTTNADGRFEIPDAAEDALVIAGLGELRSSPVAAGTDVQLVVRPTSRIEGRVTLAGLQPSRVLVELLDPQFSKYAIAAPLAADGTFSLDGAPRRRVRLIAMVEIGVFKDVHGGAEVDVRAPVVRDVTLTIARSMRSVHVLVRSTVGALLSNARVWVVQGNARPSSVRMLRAHLGGYSERMASRVAEGRVPKSVSAAARSGDLFVTVTDVPTGPATTCGLAVPPLGDQESNRKLETKLGELPVSCVPIPDKAELVTIEVPPPPRLD